MSTFIREVAESLYDKYGNDIHRLTLLMPSKRARLFLAEELLSVAGHPIWEPNYTSVDELMCGVARLEHCEQLRLVAELYKIYNGYFTKEEFDAFYHWGEVLLADFDMIDKYMVDAKQIFTNILELKAMDADLSYLTVEQRAVIERFWRTLPQSVAESKGEEQSVKEHFVGVWQHLYEIYSRFRERLQELGVGYSGMIYRSAVERLESGEAQLADERYVVVGFNALSVCEQRLFSAMQQRGCVEFYWDYDSYYVENEQQEAGAFMRQNCRRYPSAADISHDNFKNIQSINVVSSATSVIQCQYVVDVLDRLAKQSNGVLDKETAIVLTDESLLMPLLYALPQRYKVRMKEKDGVMTEETAINVTMGYPLSSTLAYSFVERLLALQQHSRGDAEEATFYYADVVGILSHPYIATDSTGQYSDLRATIAKNRLYQVPQSLFAEYAQLSKIFTRHKGWSELLEYMVEVLNDIAVGDIIDELSQRIEFLGVAVEGLQKLRNVIAECKLDISDNVCYSLVKRHLQSLRIPYNGEPLAGLQIMGILETRNLDFKNVIILSMTDSNFPGNRSLDRSYIPYSLRYGFSLPTVEHHEGVYAYYFYRLIQRAENIYMLYSSQADDISMGEPSRYIRQLEYETKFKIEHSNVGVDVVFTQSTPIKVEKSDEIYEKLLRFTKDRQISPSALSAYLGCPLKFYLQYVEYLRDDDELEEGVDDATFGNILHDAVAILYDNVKGVFHPGELLDNRYRGKIYSCIDLALSRTYFKRKDGTLPELSGEIEMIRNIIYKYINDVVLEYDIRHGEFTVVGTELPLAMDRVIDVGGESLCVHLKGKADRVDRLENGSLRVIDYKTGAGNLVVRPIEQLFTTHLDSKHINTILYALMLADMEKVSVKPALYLVRSLAQSDASFLTYNKEEISTSDAICREFEQYVDDALAEIFDREVPFVQSEGNDACTFCQYLDVCSRKVEW